MLQSHSNYVSVTLAHGWAEGASAMERLGGWWRREPGSPPGHSGARAPDLRSKAVRAGRWCDADGRSPRAVRPVRPVGLVPGPVPRHVHVSHAPRTLSTVVIMPLRRRRTRDFQS